MIEILVGQLGVGALFRLRGEGRSDLKVGVREIDLAFGVWGKEGIYWCACGSVLCAFGRPACRG